MAFYLCTGCGQRNQLNPGKLCLNCAIEGPENVRKRIAKPDPTRESGSISPMWQHQEELGYIVPVENLLSIFKFGIVSHVRASQYRHVSVSDGGVQNIRAHRKVGSRPLHEYVNLYFNPRNAMLNKVQRYFANIAVLMVDARVILNTKGVWLSNCNASTAPAEFFRSPSGLAKLDYSAIHATSWATSGIRDEVAMHAMQAEVLVPDFVSTVDLTRVLVPDASMAAEVKHHVPGASVEIDPWMFFK